jgi:hypothetical protein
VTNKRLVHFSYERVTNKRLVVHVSYERGENVCMNAQPCK